MVRAHGQETQVGGPAPSPAGFPAPTSPSPATTARPKPRPGAAAMQLQCARAQRIAARRAPGERDDRPRPMPGRRAIRGSPGRELRRRQAWCSLRSGRAILAPAAYGGRSGCTSAMSRWSGGLGDQKHALDVASVEGRLPAWFRLVKLGRRLSSTDEAEREALVSGLVLV
jgi:hypothetical protein